MSALTMSIPEFAKAVNISRGLAYQLARADKLPIPVIKLGERRLLLPRAAVLEYLNTGKTTSTKSGVSAN